jgi:sulfate adenylyltransferase subunit 1
LLGIKHIVVAINKMDLVEFKQSVFDKIKADYLKFAGKLHMRDVHFIPLSALDGDNVVNKSEHMPWYHGPALMEFLETVEIAADKNFNDFRFPVQYVNRPNLDFRGFCGPITSGVVRPGDRIAVLPSGKQSTVKSIVTFDGNLDLAFAGQSVTLTLADEIDISRGDVIVHAGNNAPVSNHFKAHLIWMNEHPLNTNRDYLFKFAGKLTPGRVVNIDYQIDVNTQQQHPADSLGLNGIAHVNIKVNQPIVVDPYAAATGVGAFIVIDRLTNLTVGAGMVSEVLASETSIAGESVLRAELNALLLESLNDAQFEMQLNRLIRKHFPQWQAKEIQDKE